MNPFYFVFCFLLYSPSFYSQETTPSIKILSLAQVIELAKEQSPSAKLAATNYLNKYWTFRTYESNYKPQLQLSTTLPDFTRSYAPVLQNDGTDAIKLQSFSTSSLNLSLSQNIALTGSQVFMSSSAQRIDILNNPGTPLPVNYLASPAIIGITQPLFMFNGLKWDKKIEPLKYEESKKQYAEDMENLSFQASDLFFNLLYAQISLEVQQKNLSNNDTLYKISVGRYNLGKIAENDLLQMELSVMNSKTALSQAQLDVDLGTLRLKTFLKLAGDEKIQLVQPNLIPQFDVDINTALAQAKANRQLIVSFERQRLEAQRDVAKAKGDNYLNGSLTATYGLTQSNPLISNLYINPLTEQRVLIGLNIPIIDWGRAKSQVQTALANRELVEINVEQAIQNFDQEIYFLVKEFKMFRQKLLISARADTIGQKSYDITMNRYLIGKIGIIDFNLIRQAKDQATLDYINALRVFWDTYFDLRRKTLYDFENNTPIKYAQVK